MVIRNLEQPLAESPLFIQGFILLMSDLDFQYIHIHLWIEAMLYFPSTLNNDFHGLNPDLSLSLSKICG